MSDLISCCSWCVAEGTEAAPPMERRTDGICGRHFLEMRARILKDRKPGVDARLLPEGSNASPQAGHGGRLGTSSHAAGATAPHSVRDADTREERKS